MMDSVFRLLEPCSPHSFLPCIKSARVSVAHNLPVSPFESLSCFTIWIPVRNEAIRELPTRWGYELQKRLQKKFPTDPGLLSLIPIFLLWIILGNFGGVRLPKIEQTMSERQLWRVIVRTGVPRPGSGLYYCPSCGCLWKKKSASVALETLC